jgi:hypothetical protein
MSAMTGRKLFGLRHAASLVVVGWILMRPPVPTYPGGKEFVDTNAALYEWEGIGTRFNSLADCEKAKENLQTKLRDEEEGRLQGAAEMDSNLSQRDTATFDAVRRAKCVSWDDLRASVRSRR